ncbi:MAG: YigZ family protein [Desulfocapsaceae bacterium]
MPVSYPIPITTVTFEQTIKQSRFICHLGHGISSSQVLRDLDRIRQAHPKAAHVCWAFIAGPPTTTDKGMSDDKEPRGTAGRPMLTLLEHSGYGEIWAGVIRYFGGIKLGKGGLIRAYTSSVQQALNLVESRTRQSLLRCRLILDFKLLPIVEQLCNQSDVDIIEKIYTDRVRMELLVPEIIVDEFEKEITRISSAAALLSLHKKNSDRS